MPHPSTGSAPGRPCATVCVSSHRHGNMQGRNSRLPCGMNSEPCPGEAQGPGPCIEAWAALPQVQEGLSASKPRPETLLQEKRNGPFNQQTRHKQDSQLCVFRPKSGDMQILGLPPTTEGSPFIPDEHMEGRKVTLARKQESCILVLILLLGCVHLDEIPHFSETQCPRLQDDPQVPDAYLIPGMASLAIALFHCFYSRQEMCTLPFLRMSKLSSRERVLIACAKVHS